VVRRRRGVVRLDLEQSDQWPTAGMDRIDAAYSEHIRHVQDNKTKRHLVVEDTDTNRRLMQRFLEGAGRGLVVDVAPNGRAALELVNTAGVHAYDVVWSDVNLGTGLSGVEVGLSVVCEKSQRTKKGASHVGQRS
jgi:hypothetical protein